MAIEFECGFEILRFSDTRYEEITVEIQYRGEAILQINKDLGIDKLEIELLSAFVQDSFYPKFKLSDFLTVIDEARKILAGEL